MYPLRGPLVKILISQVHGYGGMQARNDSIEELSFIALEPLGFPKTIDFLSILAEAIFLVDRLPDFVRRGPGVSGESLGVFD